MLTREEYETNINFSYGDDSASVYTSEPKYMRKLDKLCKMNPDGYVFLNDVKDMDGNIVGKRYLMKKKLLSFRSGVSTKHHDMPEMPSKL